MRLLSLFLCLFALPLAACGAKAATAGDDASASGDAAAADAAADIAVDVTATAPPKGYTAKFRATLANKAPAAQDEGERLFFEATWGTENGGEYPPAAFLVALWKNDPATWGEQFSQFGFFVDPGDDLPIGLKRGDVNPALVHDTCSACHTAKLADGRIWAGMPAEYLAFGAFKVALHQAWVKAGNKPYASDAQLAQWAATQPGSLDISGANDPSVFNDFPVYCDLHKMQHLNILGSSIDLRTEVYLSIFGLVDPLPFPPQDAAMAVVGYFGVLNTPQAPSPTDGAAVARGRTVFQTAKCVSCHRDDLSNDTADWLAGPEKLPGDDPAHPNGTIATEGSFLASANGSSGGSGPGPGMAALLGFMADNDLVQYVRNPTGYVANNLHGLWTTAPYLHNGSVPTLPDLLKAAKDRPATFVRGGYTVDTTKQGMSNVGHEFGSTLSDSDKADLVAYLLSL